jgi:hypothetical protein
LNRKKDAKCGVKLLYQKTVNSLKPREKEREMGRIDEE